MNDLWSTIYEQVTQVRQQFRAWYARVAGAKFIEGIYPDSFWDEVPVRPRGSRPSAEQRSFRVLMHGPHSLLMVKHSAPGNHIYFDHVNERQLEWIGHGRRDVTGKRVPIYGNMVLRTNPETLIDVIVADELLWDELRRIVMPQVAEGDKRAVDWKRYWIHAHLNAPLAYWQANPHELQEIIRVLGKLAAKIESLKIENLIDESPVIPSE
jgi:hypothetical protein